MTANENAGRRERTQRKKLALPVAMKLSDCLVRFLMAAVLAGVPPGL